MLTLVTARIHQITDLKELLNDDDMRRFLSLRHVVMDELQMRYGACIQPSNRDIDETIRRLDP
jgi:hypothetical protein